MSRSRAGQVSGVAFAKAETARSRAWNIWVVDIRTGTLRRLSRDRVGQAWGASWFPDASRVAYSVEDTTRRRESEGWSATNVSCAAEIAADSNTCRIARRRSHHLSALRRRCMGARSRERTHATCAGRRVGRGICLVTRRQPGALPRETPRRVVGLGTADDSDRWRLKLPREPPTGHRAGVRDPWRWSCAVAIPSHRAIADARRTALILSPHRTAP